MENEEECLEYTCYFFQVTSSAVSIISIDEPSLENKDDATSLPESLIRDPGNEVGRDDFYAHNCVRNVPHLLGSQPI